MALQTVSAPARALARFRLMATTDLHAQVLSYDYYADREGGAPGLAALGGLVRALRAEGIANILLDNGDFMQGNPMADWAAGEGRGQPHPVVAAMNVIGFDAAALGNHEFNYGLSVLEKVTGEAVFPLLSANLSVPGWKVQPWVMLTRSLTDTAGVTRDLKIGVIGLAPPQICQWERLTLEGKLAACDMVATAARLVPQIRAAGADLVVVLAHTGIGDGARLDENVGLDLAEIAGIDAMVLGHVHEIFPDPAAAQPDLRIDHGHGRLGAVATVMPGYLASHLGVVDFTLSHDGTRWVPAECAVRLVEVAPHVPDPAVAEVMAAAHGHVLERIRRDVGHSARAVNSHFALVRADDSLQVVADAQWEAARAVLAGSPAADLPLLSAVAPFRAGGRAGPQAYIDLPAGPLSLSNAAELYLYPNSLCIVETTGAVVREWLERSAGLFNRLIPGQQDQPLINPAFPSYNFDVIFGLTYRIDPSVPVFAAGGRRIHDLCFAGRPVRDEQRFAVVTNTYRAGGAGGFEVLVEGARILHRDPRKLRDVVIDYLHHASPRAAEPVWRFAPIAKTAAWFQSSPAAVPPPDLARDLTDLGLDGQGFRRFRLSLA